MNVMHQESSHANKIKYHVQTSDVLQDMRVNVSLAGQSEVIWHKERFLEDKEIVEHIIHNASNTICWSIHRPLRGWYIRIRAPSFPSGVFIQLTPVANDASYHVEGALSFNSRTNVPISLPNLDSQNRASVASSRESVDSQSTSASLHSYPPTPTTQTPSSSPPKYNIPLESSSSGSKSSIGNMSSASSSTSTLVSPTPPLTATSSKARSRPRPVSHIPSSQTTQFVLAPSSIPPAPTQEASTSLFSRALSALKNSRPSHSNSFTLCRVIKGPPLQHRISTVPPSAAPSSPPPPYASTAALVAESSRQTPLNQPPVSRAMHPVLYAPLLTFHDQTSLLTVRSLSGLLEIDKTEESQLGVDTSFWIAVALTYLEFLEERESYLAALSD